jgi:hypothetical protein
MAEIDDRLRQLMLAHEAVCADLVAERRRSEDVIATLQAMRDYVTLPMHRSVTQEILIRDLKIERTQLRAQLAEAKARPFADPLIGDDLLKRLTEEASRLNEGLWDIRLAGRTDDDQPSLELIITAFRTAANLIATPPKKTARSKKSKKR